MIKTKDVQKSYLPFLFILLPILLIMQACRHFPQSAENGGIDGIKLHRPASEKAIYLEMGQGLMGKNFELMPRPTRRKALEAEYRALEYGHNGQTVAWQGETGRDFGIVTVGHPYKVGSQNCRQYQHDFTIATVTHKASGGACRNKDGSWTPL